MSKNLSYLSETRLITRLLMSPKIVNIYDYLLYLKPSHNHVKVEIVNYFVTYIISNI